MGLAFRLFYLSKDKVNLPGINRPSLSFIFMPLSYMVYGSFGLLALALVIYLVNLRKRR